MTPEDMDRWLAFGQVEMDPFERLAGILKLGFATMAQHLGMDLQPDAFEPQRNRRPKGKRPSPGQAAAIARATLPGAGGQ